MITDPPMPSIPPNAPATRPRTSRAMISNGWSTAAVYGIDDRRLTIDDPRRQQPCLSAVQFRHRKLKSASHLCTMKPGGKNGIKRTAGTIGTGYGPKAQLDGFATLQTILAG